MLLFCIVIRSFQIDCVFTQICFINIHTIYLAPATDFSKYGAASGNGLLLPVLPMVLVKNMLFSWPKGFSIVLVSRTQSKLELIATEIESKYKVNTKLLHLMLLQTMKKTI